MEKGIGEQQYSLEMSNIRLFFFLKNLKIHVLWFRLQQHVLPGERHLESDLEIPALQPGDRVRVQTHPASTFHHCVPLVSAHSLLYKAVQGQAASFRQRTQLVKCYEI